MNVMSRQSRDVYTGHVTESCRWTSGSIYYNSRVDVHVLCDRHCLLSVVRTNDPVITRV